ncbi:MAG: leucyl/phenylalanyl-tRNA--protein transferase [Planctomycetaceae bacterium]|jgi:leucyl/phenylalanyl-tRNA---protein transferase|nr:leucyl/phenylalanyl-tRNA--protein transferase [Planctomycetaceae bacterium]
MAKLTNSEIQKIWHQSRIAPILPAGPTANEFGVVAVGGSLSSRWVLNAYAQGVFPWPLDLGHDTEEKLLGWFCPDPRAVLLPADLHIPRRLGRKIRSGRFSVTSDRAFGAVISACSGPRKIEGEVEAGTWITEEMKSVYTSLYEKGIAHSIEVWQEEALVGGLYGIAVGTIFCGESMFHHVGDASRVALCVLVEHLESWGFSLLDVQQSTPHCSVLGAVDIPRATYLQILETGFDNPAVFGVIGGLDIGQ